MGPIALAAVLVGVASAAPTLDAVVSSSLLVHGAPFGSRRSLSTMASPSAPSLLGSPWKAGLLARWCGRPRSLACRAPPGCE